jgi:hypothetical protein
MHMPGWADMPDIDKGAAIAFLWRRGFDGGPTAFRETPCLYREHPALVALTPRQACNHAITLYLPAKALPRAEWQRLHDLAAQPSPEGTPCPS